MLYVVCIKHLISTEYTRLRADDKVCLSRALVATPIYPRRYILQSLISY